jgi:hypothetical protein
MPLDGPESVQAIESNARYITAKDTYDDIHRFVEVDYDAVLVNYWDGGDAAFREHVDNIKYGSVHGGSRNRVIRVLPQLGLSH